MIKNIAFDWSGVISDSAPVFHQLVLNMFKQFGLPPISLEELRREWRQPYMEFYHKYDPLLTIEDQNVAYSKAYKEVMQAHPPQAYPGIVDLLKRLKKLGKKMIIISSDIPDNLQIELVSFGLDGIFDEVNADVHDKASGLSETLKRNGFRSAETIFIGDTTHEIEAGKSVGMLTGGVTWGFHDEDKLRASNPDYVIHNVKELEEIIVK